MLPMRMALVQANPTVGALAANAALAQSAVAEATADGAQIVAFPEMFLTGYPVEDLALRPSFQEASRKAVEELARMLAKDGLGDVPVVIGYLDRIDNQSAPLGGPINTAAIVQNGSIVAKYVKHHLPNYGVFDEFRYFVPGHTPCVVRVAGVDVSLAICEDLWQEGGLVSETRGSGLLLVINGSPYERNKARSRLDLCQRRAAETGAVVAYVNMVGGQDELVFDGGSLVVTPKGATLARAGQFESEILLVDLELPAGTRTDARDLGTPQVRTRAKQKPRIAPRMTDTQEVYNALVCGLHDYVEKNNFGSVILGVSGGIDSALVASIACDALGSDRVHGVSLPSAYSSEHSLFDAADLADRTGLHYRTLPIIPLVDTFEKSLALSGLARENLQARVRGVMLMALSNSEGHLVLATGNKSEISVGYSTIYGDAVGGFAPIKDVPKTLVWELARWRNTEAERRGETPPIPPNSIQKPPSAELRPGQLDQDFLPDYALLDDILEDYIEHDRGISDLVGKGFDVHTVERVIYLTDTAEYKRRQYPLGTKISLRAFGRDRRQPITNHSVLRSSLHEKRPQELNL